MMESISKENDLVQHKTEDIDKHRIINPVSGKNFRFYITNLESYLNKDKVTKEFKSYGEIKEICVKKSSYTKYYLAYIKISNLIKSAEEIISLFYKRHGWKVSLNYQEEVEKDKPKKEKRHLCGRRNKDQKSRSVTLKKKTRRARSNSRNKNNSALNHSKQEVENINLINTTLIPCPTNIREIWVGNLPSTITEQEVKNIFFVHGEIENIDLFSSKQYAFIRFFQCSSAIKAFELDNEKMTRGHTMKIKLSNPNKRKDVLNDKSGYEVSEHNCTIIHVNLSANCKIATESSIKDLFSQYGKLKAWNIRREPPNVYIQYEKVEEAKEAIKKLMSLDTSGEKRKLLGDAKCNVSSYYKENKKIASMAAEYSDINNLSGLGNNNMETLFLQQALAQSQLNNTYLNMNYASGGVNNLNLLNTGAIPALPQSFADALNLIKFLQIMNPNLVTPSYLNTLSSINTLNTLNTTTSPTTSSSQTPNMISNSTNPNTPESISPMILNMYNIQNNPFNKNFNQNSLHQSMPYYLNGNGSGNTINQQQVEAFSPMLYMPTQQDCNNTPLNINQNPSQFNSPIITAPVSQSVNSKNVAQTKKNTDSSIACNSKSSSKFSNNPQIKESSSNLPSSIGSLFENEYSLEPENLKLVWSGNLTKNNKTKVGVVAYQIRNDCYNFLNNDLNLNIEHRTVYEDVTKRQHKGMLVFSPQNETQVSAFDEYCSYLNDRQRVGIAYLKNNIDLIYIIAPSEFSRKFYRNPKKHLLGIFVEKKINVTDSIFSFPPPVVSLAEKKIILNGQKQKNQITNK